MENSTPIIFQHDQSKVIGKISWTNSNSAILEISKDAMITRDMLFDAFDAGLQVLESEIVEDDNGNVQYYITKATVHYLNISGMHAPNDKLLSVVMPKLQG